MFKVAPVGSTIYMEQPPSWCTSIAHKARRSIKTQKAISHLKRGGHSIEMTRVEFVGAKPALQKKLRTPDPHQTAATP
jgi:hypothetical protein